MEAHNTTRELPYCEEIAEAAKDGDQPQGLEFVGILVALLSTLISTFCLMWIKRSTEVEKGLPVLPCACFGGSFGKPWRRILVIAMVGNLLSEAFLSTIAYLFAPLSRILPVAGSALIFSGLIASMGLVPGIKEKLSIAEWAALVFTLCAMVGTSLSGPNADNVMAFDDWQAQWARPSVVVHFVVVLVIGLSWLLLVTACTARNPWAVGTLPYMVVSSASSGGLGSWAVLFCKVWMTALQIAVTTGDTRGIHYWVTWFSVGGFALCGPLQLYFMDKALTGGKASFGVPLYFVMIINLTVLLDGHFFRAFDCMDGGRAAAFAVSLACVAAGTCMLAREQQRSTPRVADVPSEGPAVAPAAKPHDAIPQSLFSEAPSASPGRTRCACDVSARDSSSGEATC